MRNASLILALVVAALGACHKQQQQQMNNATISMDADVPDNQMVAGNADIETLPADESSTTPSNQLQNGFDNPDVNDVGTAGNSQ
ncbi:MAG TPA: hypothetical protein VE820_12050 [Sphingomicrobium sp.]|nr:hypothetical protein [Sphingomicrobium sp.]